MPYPLMMATNGDMFARLNPDITWSVRWDRVLDIAYTTPEPRQRAVWGFAKLLVAAKDNFILTPWAASEQMGNHWTHYEAIIDYLDEDPIALLSSVTYNGNMIARINYDGTWSVRWDDVLTIARWRDRDYRATALIGICQLLRAAQDRFLVAPWEIETEDC